MKAEIWFDWANWLYVNGKPVRQVSNEECFRIGTLLQWYGGSMEKSQLVRYCPGNASGSPATMTRAEAEQHLKHDSAHIEVMKRAGALPQDAQLPHIGGTCKLCKRD